MLIILGGPGSGKGTQGRMLSKSLGVRFLSAGDSLKKTLRENQELMDRINKGMFLDDDHTNKIIMSRLATLKKGDVFEGFPRTLKQANHLFNNFNMSLISGVVLLDVDKNVIMERIDRRYICSLCHEPYAQAVNCCGDQAIKRIDDQSSKAIEQRINNYNNTIGEIVQFFQNNSVTVCNVNGMNTMVEVMKDILQFYHSVQKSAGE